MKISQYFLPVLLFYCFPFTTKAQYSYTPSTTLIKNQVLNTLTYDSIHVTNNSSSKLFLNWSLINSDTIGGSYFDFCASGNCYLGIPDTGSLPDIDPGQFGWIGMHFWTGSIPGTCTAKVWMYEEGNPGNGDTLTFILNALGSNAVDNNLEINNSISIGPNPTKGKVEVSSLRYQINRVAIFNIRGENVLSTLENSHSTSFDLATFPDGTYFVKINTGNGYLTKIIILKK